MKKRHRWGKTIIVKTEKLQQYVDSLPRSIGTNKRPTDIQIAGTEKPLSDWKSRCRS
jgi:hypothetical protein